jgi:hypothetical protein
MGRGLSRRLHPITVAVAPPGGGHRTFSTLLPCGFTPADDFVLRRVLNHDGMNMLSQLNISVCFTLQTICLGSALVYVAQGFRTVNRARLLSSLVQHIVQK